MYKATRDFIKARQAYSGMPIVYRSDIKNIGGGLAKRCFTNAYDIAEKSKLTNKKIICISGWIVNKFDKLNNCTAIIQHWWNMDDSGRHLEIYDYSRINYEHINSNLVPSLMLQDGKYSALVNEERMSFVDLNDLRIETLFALQRLELVTSAVNEQIEAGY
jgi:hypothetical protein